MTKSLLLDQATWDLTADTSGNIAVGTQEYSLAQDAACFVKLFRGEIIYDTTQGIPYWQQVLGKFPPLSLCKSLIEAAARDVPGVVDAKCFLSGIEGRVLSGQVQVTNIDGKILAASF
jgi:hypothetical protein